MKVFNSLKDAFKYSKKGEFYIFYRGVFFPLKWDFKGCSNTVIFLPGRTARGRKPVPVFQRSSYFDDIEANVISCFDPTLFWGDMLSLGWFQGRGSIFYGELVGDLLAKAVSVFKNKNENVFLYGTSGGGIPGFNIAKKIPGCTLYVSNIQTDASRYHRRFFDEMIQVSYPRLKAEEVISRFSDRVSVLNIDASFNLIYSQNKCDIFHYDNHFMPYFQAGSFSSLVNKKFYLFNDQESGHDPLPKEYELSIISALLGGGSVSDLLPNCESIS